MRKFERVITLTICLAMLCCVFTACNGDEAGSQSEDDFEYVSLVPKELAIKFIAYGYDLMIKNGPSDAIGSAYSLVNWSDKTYVTTDCTVHIFNSHPIYYSSIYIIGFSNMQSANEFETYLKSLDDITYHFQDNYIVFGESQDMEEFDSFKPEGVCPDKYLNAYLRYMSLISDVDLEKEMAWVLAYLFDHALEIDAEVYDNNDLSNHNTSEYGAYYLLPPNPTEEQRERFKNEISNYGDEVVSEYPKENVKYYAKDEDSAGYYVVEKENA